MLERLRGVRARPWEVGGWLLGYWTEDRGSLVVTHATPPISRGTPFGVQISGKGHRVLFDAAWDASAGAVTFLGDWHTHPRGAPSPSKRDRRAVQKLATEPDYGTPNPLLAISATGRWPWSMTLPIVRFFVGRPDQDPTRIEPIPFADLPAAAAAVPHGRWD